VKHVLRISRRIDYGLRAMLLLSSLPPRTTVSRRELALRIDVPEPFLAKILKTLVDRGLVRSARGSRGGYALARPADAVSFLDVIEAVEGPVAINACLDGDGSCGRAPSCTMLPVWRAGQERMLDVFRQVKLSKLALEDGGPGVGLVQLSGAACG